MHWKCVKLKRVTDGNSKIKLSNVHWLPIWLILEYLFPIKCFINEKTYAPVLASSTIYNLQRYTHITV